MSKIWLHRITAGAEMSYTLLQSGYLTVGFSCFLEDKTKKDALQLIRPDIELAERERLFWDICAAHGMEKYKGRWSLKHFLFDFAEGDMVLVPGSGSFRQCFIAGPAQAVSFLPMEIIPKHDGSGSPVVLKNILLVNGDDGRSYDIGFVRRIRCERDEWIERDRANASLINRMKIRITTADISDLTDAVQKAMNAAGPIDFRQCVRDRLSDDMLNLVREEIREDTLESLIKWYFIRIGASEVTIPAKNERGKTATDESDADVVATFENLKVIIYVQAKKHWGITDNWSVTQVSNYVARKNVHLGSDEYTRIAWVISTCDDFDVNARNQAGFNLVRLINGKEFAGMLLDAGVYGMKLE